MREIAIFTPQFNRVEEEEISTLYEQIWNSLVSNFDPEILTQQVDGLTVDIPTFIKHSIRVQRNDVVSVLDTSIQPYLPVYNRYLLKLILDNILED